MLGRADMSVGGLALAAKNNRTMEAAGGVQKERGVDSLPDISGPASDLAAHPAPAETPRKALGRICCQAREKEREREGEKERETERERERKRERLVVPEVPVTMMRICCKAKARETERQRERERESKCV